MLLRELFLIETWGRGGWLNATTGEYHNLFFDINGLVHDEYAAKHPDKFGGPYNEIGEMYNNGWVRVVYPESNMRAPGEQEWLGLEGAPRFVQSRHVREYVNQFMKGTGITRVDITLVDVNTNRHVDHRSFEMPFQRSQMNAFLRGK